jgi:cell division septation protein DedD
MVHVEYPSTWLHRALANFGATDPHVPDDDVFAILNADNDGSESTGEMCVAKGISVPMYCVWKRKYGQLSIEQVRSARRKQLWRARAILAILASVPAALIVGLAVVIVTSFRQPVDSNAVRASAPPIAPTVVQAPPPMTTPNVSSEPVPAAATRAEQVAPAPTTRPAAESISPESASPVEPGYKVQVAAAPTLAEATALIERLTSAGHAAYLSRAIVRDVEVFRVRVGPLDTLAAAEEVTAKLKSDGFKGTWISR